jgi:hypothetical protein
VAQSPFVLSSNSKSILTKVCHLNSPIVTEKNVAQVQIVVDQIQYYGQTEDSTQSQQ